MNRNFSTSIDYATSLCIEVFDMYPPLNKREFISRYRELAIEYHPDQGGNVEQFKKLQSARETILSFDSLFVGIRDNNLPLMTTNHVLLSDLGKGYSNTINVVSCDKCEGDGYKEELRIIDKKNCPNMCMLHVKRCGACKGTRKFTQARSRRVVDCLTCKGTGQWNYGAGGYFTSGKIKNGVCSICNNTGIYGGTKENVYMFCSPCNGVGELTIFNPVLQRGAFGLVK